MKLERSANIKQAILTALDRHEATIDGMPDLKCFSMLVYVHGDCLDPIEVRYNTQGERTRLDKSKRL